MVYSCLLTRVYQELARGVIDLSNAKRICRYPFPFPYAQIEAVLLLLHWSMSVWFAGTTMTHPLRSFVYAFVPTFCLWSMHYTALEIEQPYGDDKNDLPLDMMQMSLNDSLVNLLHPLTQALVTVQEPDVHIQCELWRASFDPNRRMKQKEHALPKERKSDEGTKRYNVGLSEKSTFQQNLHKAIAESSSSNGSFPGDTLSASKVPNLRTTNTSNLSTESRITRTIPMDDDHWKGSLQAKYSVRRASRNSSSWSPAEDFSSQSSNADIMVMGSQIVHV